jgi:hypothetical protein
MYNVFYLTDKEFSLIVIQNPEQDIKLMFYVLFMYFVFMYYYVLAADSSNQYENINLFVVFQTNILITRVQSFCGSARGKAKVVLRFFLPSC